MKRKIGRFSIFVAGLIVGLLMIPMWASADFIFNIGTGNSAISGFPGPYAQVDVSLTDSTHATITFTSLTNSGNIYLLGSTSAVDVNVNATSWTLGTITGSNAGTGFNPGPWSNGGSGNVSDAGIFNQTINSFDSYTHSSDTISFVLTDTGGSWASANSVLTANAKGNLAAAHIIVASSPANTITNPTALATGFATTTKVPEPGTFLLLSTGLLGLAIYGRMKVGK